MLRNMKIQAFLILLTWSASVLSQPEDLGAQILSAYHGLDAVTVRANRFCDMPVRGQDGMPLTFSVQIDGESVSPEVFAVETGTGETVAPMCATLRPAIEPLERRTVLLVGPFGTTELSPRAVEIVGELLDASGNSLRGLRTEDVTPLSAGPSLTFAESFDPGTPGLADECPEESSQAILLTFEGGVTGPEGADLAEPQRTAMSVLLKNGDRVHPLHLGDDDPDNHVVACIAEISPAVAVEVEAGFFHDPGDDANPSTRVDVIHRR